MIPVRVVSRQLVSWYAVDLWCYSTIFTRGRYKTIFYIDQIVFRYWNNVQPRLREENIFSNVINYIWCTYTCVNQRSFHECSYFHVNKWYVRLSLNARSIPEDRTNFLYQSSRVYSLTYLLKFKILQTL